MRKWLWLFVVLVLLFVAGCALTDDQIMGITSAVQTGVSTAAAPVVSVAAPGLDSSAVNGIAAAAGLVVAYGLRQLLLLLRKKPESE